MKISRLNLHNTSVLAMLTAVLMLGTVCVTEANVLTGRPLTPQEIHDNHLAEGTMASGGLFTVGVGEPVYLEALVDKGVTAPGSTWSLLEKPAGSAAFIDVSPIPMEMKIYSPADREVYDLADRMMLIPDVVGVYVVEVRLITSEGTVVLSEQITGANYVGSGIVLDSTGEMDPLWEGPDYPQCALCHAWDPDGKVASYAGTGHATFFQEAIDGIKSSHYGSYCMDCHVLGGHAPDLENGNFADVAEHVGWTFPEVLEPGNWDAMPLELRAKANIQCEHCHGAGSEHHGIHDTISVSLNSGDCGQCHDEKPYHNKNRQWEISGHSRAPARTRGSCAGCHTGDGFINRIDGAETVHPQGETIVCAACHDPHSNDMDNHQLRYTGDITLENDEVVTLGGKGKFCMNCHKARRNAEEYVQGNVSSHYGPHYGIQGDLFNGTNAIEYGKVQGGPAVHAYVVEDSCVGCHMQAVSNSDPAKSMVGEHTFRMTWDVNNTPDDHHDDIPRTNVCTECHGPVDSFDMPQVDYNYDFKVEGIQTEVHHLLEALALKLHPVGSPEVIRGDSNHVYSDKEKKALYNYMCVEEDHSFGIHNPDYITGILRASIDDMGDPSNAILGGSNVPAGGEWFYSSWFNYYRPIDEDGWIDHVELGLVNISGDADEVIIWDPRLGKWFWTNAEVYPVLYDIEDGEWMFFQGRFSSGRFFYSLDSGEWVTAQ